MAILICLLTLLPSGAKAQMGFDVTSVEAYINDHKQQRSLLLVRSTLEASNKLLHDYSGDANIGFKDINKELDKYTRAFDVIDVLYQTLRTSLNVYNTYENVSDRVGDYRKMLNDYKKKCLERGNIMSTDTLIITINAKALAKIADEGDNLYRSVNDLVLYATGKGTNLSLEKRGEIPISLIHNSFSYHCTPNVVIASDFDLKQHDLRKSGVKFCFAL